MELNCKKGNFRRFLLLGIPVQIILGILLHFIFNFTRQNMLIGIIAPVNESVFEHLKLIFFPASVWWIIGWIIYGKRCTLDPNRYLAGCAANCFMGVIIVVAGHYMVKGMFGKAGVIFDIALFIIAVAIGAFCGFCVNKYSVIGIGGVFLSFVILLLLLTSFILFTFAPPHIPFFRDFQTGEYGIMLMP